MDIFGLIAAILFIIFFLNSLKSMIEKKQSFMLYTILSSICFGVLFFFFMMFCAK